MFALSHTKHGLCLGYFKSCSSHLAWVSPYLAPNITVNGDCHNIISVMNQLDRNIFKQTENILRSD